MQPVLAVGQRSDHFPWCGHKQHSKAQQQAFQIRNNITNENYKSGQKLFQILLKINFSSICYMHRPSYSPPLNTIIWCAIQATKPVVLSCHKILPLYRANCSFCNSLVADTCSILGQKQLGLLGCDDRRHTARRHNTVIPIFTNIDTRSDVR